MPLIDQTRPLKAPLRLDGVTDRTEQVQGWLANADHVVALTGAGISTESGIPDFRGPQGVWTKDPSAQAMFTIDSYVANPEVRRRAWSNRRDHPAWSAEPNAGHHALVELERQGKLTAVVTQNIDGLHQRAGNSARTVHELHGTIWQAICLTCEELTAMRVVLDRVDAGEEDPACWTCGGLMKSATISFGQSLDRQVLQAAVTATSNCDVMLAIGTSLQVHPAAALCDVAKQSGARLVIVNASATPYDDQADAVVRDPIGDVLPRLVSATTAP